MSRCPHGYDDDDCAMFACSAACAKEYLKLQPRQKEAMPIVTQQYLRKPLYVDAVQVTDENMQEIAKWCQGDIREEGGRGHYVYVRVHSPRSPRQTRAFPGDWILYTERGYKVYTTLAFEASFDVVGKEEE